MVSANQRRGRRVAQDLARQGRREQGPGPARGSLMPVFRGPVGVADGQGQGRRQAGRRQDQCLANRRQGVGQLGEHDHPDVARAQHFHRPGLLGQWRARPRLEGDAAHQATGPNGPDGRRPTRLGRHFASL